MIEVLARRSLLCGLVLLCCGVGSVLAQSPAEAPPPTFQARPLEDFQQMIDRPLFTSNRKPVVDAEAPVGDISATEQQLRDTWRLTGIVLEPERQLALFSQRNGEQHQQLEIGMLLDGQWRLERIAADRVVLQEGEQKAELPLFDPKNLPVAEARKPPARARGGRDGQAPQPGQAQKATAAPGEKGAAQPVSPPKK